MQTKMRGDLLLNETAKIILAVISIVILIYLAVSLYGVFRDKQQLEQARASIHEIAGIAGALGEKEVRNYLLLAPRGWYLTEFKNSQKENCQQQCICMCQKDDCTGSFACAATAREFLFTDSKGKAVLVLHENPPVSLELNLQGTRFLQAKVKT